MTVDLIALAALAVALSGLLRVLWRRVRPPARIDGWWHEQAPSLNWTTTAWADASRSSLQRSWARRRRVPEPCILVGYDWRNGEWGWVVMETDPKGNVKVLRTYVRAGGLPNEASL